MRRNVPRNSDCSGPPLGRDATFLARPGMTTRAHGNQQLTYADFVAFRKSLPRTPRLERQTVRARGIAFAVFTSPHVAGAVPLVCVNGGMLYDHSMLWPALSPLAAKRQVILYDQRGRGESSAPASPADMTIEDDAADIGALRRALGIRSWDVLGHSWGGGIAMLAAAR